MLAFRRHFMLGHLSRNYLPSSYTSPNCQHSKSYNYQYEITVNSYYDRPMSGSLGQSWILEATLWILDHLSDY